MTSRQRTTSSSTDPPVRREVVLAVDTHGEVHVAAVVSPLGKILGTESFPATAAGYRQLLVWARKRGTVRRAGVEGTGTFGAGLSRYLLAQQIQVYEVNRPDRSARRLLGKSDPLDAQAAARAVLSGRARAQAKSGDGPVHSARMLKLAKDSAVKARTQAINQLKAVLVIADPALRERLSGLGNAELFRTCATLSPPDGGGDEDAVAQATHMTLRMLAERIEQLSGQINELNQRLTRLVERYAPQLLVPVGIGPDSAATLLITMGDNPERLNTEASFAALCGVGPIEYSSGRRRTRRLNCGGDRQANAALHRIVFTRLRHDPRTQAYYERRTQERKTDARSSDASSDMPPERSSTCQTGFPHPRVLGASVRRERVWGVSETPPNTLQYRFDGPEDAPVLILGPSLGTTWHRL
ncbi:IS110 family transposase [Streptomyces vinaceusdrappus]|nr:IS110 family transposase [Streptomyces plicatus]GHC36198.1 IS110 family transposase [Streptomyces vinaceusdrappus]